MINDFLSEKFPPIKTIMASHDFSYGLICVMRDHLQKRINVIFKCHGIKNVQVIMDGYMQEIEPSIRATPVAFHVSNKVEVFVGKKKKKKIEFANCHAEADQTILF